MDFSKLPPGAFIDYWRDFAQRSILFLDILRRRGNQYEEMRARPINSVLIYDFKFVLRGDSLPRSTTHGRVFLRQHRAR
jgi:hypothetical protein